MGFYFYVSMKNILRQRKRSFSLGINYAIVAFILVLLLSFSDGARDNITRSVALASAGHVTVSGTYYIEGKAYNGILRTGDIEKTIADYAGSGASMFPRYIMRSAVYYNGLSKRLQFTGIDTKTDTRFKDQLDFTSGSWEEFASNPAGVVMPEEFISYFGLRLDDDILIATRTRFGAFNTGTLKVKGIYKTANFFTRGQVISHLEFLRGLDLGPADSSSVLFVYFKDASDFGKKRDAIMPLLGKKGFVVSKPKDDADAINAVSAASPRYKKVTDTADRIELVLSTLDEATGIVKNITAAVNGIGIFISFVMLFIIAISIFINLRMTINDRLSEIGTMRTIGMRGGSVTLLFMTESLLLALMFTILGIACALIVVALFAFVIPMPQIDILSLFLAGRHLVLAPSVAMILAVTLIILAFAAIFSFIPARYGGKIRPVDALNRVF
jgi:ABC-type lipoprotein release transport system permease subunit